MAQETDQTLKADSYDAFISYNHSDEAFAKYVQEGLEASGLSVFRDATDMKLFDKLDAKLKASIASSSKLVSIISPAYLQSYWCLFEALEAIQGQALEAKFLPLIVQPTDEKIELNVEFVFKVLGDIRAKITELQEKIMSTRTFALHESLDKLTFVESSLPKIFNFINERVYPEFRLFDPDSVKATLDRTIREVWPDVSPVLGPFNFVEAVEAGPRRFSELEMLPEILWKQQVGCFAWKNRIIALGNDVFATSSGSAWNRPDGQDGIYRLDAATGDVHWFCSTETDPNSLLVCKGLALTGCDDGTLIAVSCTNGEMVWSRRFPSGIVGGPVKLSGDIGSSGEGPPLDPILICTYAGDLHLVDLATGQIMRSLSLGSNVVAGIGRLGKIWMWEMVAIPAIDGTLYFVSYDWIHPSLTLLGSVVLRYPSEYSDSGEEIAELAAAPFVRDGSVYQGLVRNTYYPEAPLARIDASFGEGRFTADVVWPVGGESAGGGFGNLRHPPVLAGTELVIAPAYTDALFGIDMGSGAVLWEVELGQTMFEQWSCPLAVYGSIYVSRHDGYVHKIDQEGRARKWSLYLGSSQSAGMTASGRDTPPEFNDRAAWRAGASSPIVATPEYARDRLYVGTTDGWLYCVSGV